jgi:hypothetical protein
MKVWMRLGACLVLTACVTLPPSVHRFESTRMLEVDYREVWSAVLKVFEENGWEVERTEEGAGAIVSAWISDTAGGGDYGQRGMSNHVEPGSEQVTVNVRVIRDSAKQTRVRVHCFFRARWAGKKEKGMWGSGTSRGIWEARVLQQIEDAVQ